MYRKIVLQSLLFCVCSIAPILTRDLFGRNEYYSFSIYNNEAVGDKINLKMFREKGSTITATLKLDKIQTTGYTKCRSATEVNRIEASCGKKNTECLRLLKDDIKTVALVRGKNYYSYETAYYCNTDTQKFTFLPCPGPSKSKADDASNSGERTNVILHKAIGLFFLMDEYREPDPYQPSQEFFYLCNSGKEMGTLLVTVYQHDGNIIELKLDLKDVCEHPEPSFLIKFRHFSPISLVEVSCEKPHGLCPRLVRHDLHVMKLFYGEKNNCMETDNYFCKREMLDPGKHLYMRCGQKLSTDAIRDKKRAEYVHMIFVEPEYSYFRIEKPITTIRMNENQYNVRRAGRNDRVYQFLAPIFSIDYILIASDESNAHITRFTYLREGSHLTMYCLDEKEKLLDGMHKFIEC